MIKIKKLEVAKNWFWVVFFSIPSEFIKVVGGPIR
jgi:hypothetical protein